MRSSASVSAKHNIGEPQKSIKILKRGTSATSKGTFYSAVSLLLGSTFYMSNIW